MCTIRVGLRPRCALGRGGGGDGGVFQSGAARHSLHVSGVYGKAGLAILSQIVSIHLPVMMAASIILYRVGVEARWRGRPASKAVVALVTGFFLPAYSPIR
jgi:hypothetical protein